MNICFYTNIWKYKIFLYLLLLISIIAWMFLPGSIAYGVFAFFLLYIMSIGLLYGQEIEILKFIIFYIIIQYFLKINLNIHPRISLIDDFVFYILFAALVIKRKKHFKWNSLLVPVCLIFLAGIISGFLNHSPFYITILGLRGYLQYVLLVFVIINLNIDKEELIRLANYFIDLFIIIQIPFILFQVTAAFSSGIINSDTVRGSFGNGGANILSYAAFIPLFYIMGRINAGEKVKISDKLRLFFLLVILIFPQGRFAIVLMPLVYFFIYFPAVIRKKIIRIRTAWIFILFFIIFFLFLVLTNLNNIKMYDIYSNFTSWEYNVSSGSNRYLWIELVWKYISKTWKTMLIGFGPGEFWSCIAGIFNRPLVQETFNYWGQLEKGVDAGCATGLVPVLGEFGLLGFIIFLFIYLKNYFFSTRAGRLNSDNSEIKILSQTVIAGTIMMVLGVYIHMIWEAQNIVFIYWFFTGLLYKYSIIRKEPHNVS